MEKQEIALRVEGLTFAVQGDEPRIKDLDLAERLGFKQPRMIRKLIKRHVAEGNIEAGGVCSTVAQTSAKGGRPSEEMWLNESAALFIAAKSDTEGGDVVLRDLVRLWVAVRRQMIAVPAGPDPETIALIDRQSAALTLALRRVADLEQSMRLLAAKAEDAAMLHTNRAEARAVRNLIAAAADACSTPERRVTFKAMEGVIRVRQSDADGEGWNVPGYLSLRRSVVPIVRDMLTRYIDGRSVFIPAACRRASAPRMPRMRRPRRGKGQGEIVFPRPIATNN